MEPKIDEQAFSEGRRVRPPEVACVPKVCHAETMVIPGTIVIGSQTGPIQFGMTPAGSFPILPILTQFCFSDPSGVFHDQAAHAAFSRDSLSRTSLLPTHPSRGLPGHSGDASLDYL